MSPPRPEVSSGPRMVDINTGALHRQRCTLPPWEQQTDSDEEGKKAHTESVSLEICLGTQETQERTGTRPAEQVVVPEMEGIEDIYKKLDKENIYKKLDKEITDIQEGVKEVRSPTCCFPGNEQRLVHSGTANDIELFDAWIKDRMETFPHKRPPKVPAPGSVVGVRAVRVGWSPDEEVFFVELLNRYIATNTLDMPTLRDWWILWHHQCGEENPKLESKGSDWLWDKRKALIKTGRLKEEQDGGQPGKMRYTLFRSRRNPDCIL